MTPAEWAEALSGRTLRARVAVLVLAEEYAGDPEAGVEYLQGYLDGTNLALRGTALLHLGRDTWFGDDWHPSSQLRDGTAVIQWPSRTRLVAALADYAWCLQEAMRDGVRRTETEEAGLPDGEGRRG